MGRYNHRPIYAADYGQVETVGSGVVLGDGNDGTFKRYYENAGSILTYPTFPSTGAVPTGRDIIAVRVGLRQRNTGLFGLYNGWVASSLRIDDKKQESTYTYKQDGYNDSAREILGPPMYYTNLASWPVDALSSLSTEVGAAVGEIGPSKNRWCVCTESFIAVVYEEPVPVPVANYPADNATIATSSVSFKAKSNIVQSEQPVAAVFQVARDNAFTNDVRTFVGGLNDNAADQNSTSNYVSVIGDTSYTDLGPGVWYMRIKGRDFRNKESAWGATTKFTISHAALPVPSLSAPLANSTVPSPYANRSAVINQTPSGDRYVGVEFQFSKISDFSSGVVSWANTKDGIYFAAASDPKTITYNPKPDATVAAGLRSGKVGLEDPSQYLTQGIWYARVRAIDKYLQTGSFSATTQFTVSHPPVPSGLLPNGGMSFDQDVTQVTWVFGDPWADDYQSAYQMIVSDPSSNILQDTGKVNSNVKRAKMNIPSSWLNTSGLKLSVKVWDSDDVASTVIASGTFRLVKAPIITLTYPGVDEQIITGQPNLQWSCVFSRAGVTQKSFRARFTKTDTGTLAFDSGVVNSTATSYLPPTPILKNLSGYQLSLTITDSEDVSNTVLRNFSTNFERPAKVVSNTDATDYTETGYTVTDWVTGVPDAFFMEWRIYRRPSGDEFIGQWTLAGTVANPNVRTFNDWLVAGNGYFKYCVVQAAYRFGSIVEGSFDENADDVYIQGDSYWLICPTAPELNVKMYISDEKFTGNREIKEQTIKGRGRIIVYGTNIGKSGNLTCQVRHSDGVTASEKLRMIEAIANNNFECILKTPFGQTWKIALGEIGVSRIAGVGVSEFADLDIPYWEVF